MAQKRDFDDFAHDALVSRASPPTKSPHQQDTKHSSIVSHVTNPGMQPTDHKQQNGVWEVAESKKSKKRKRKKEAAQLEAENAAPNLRFSSFPQSSLRIKDLQSLVLYTLSDGVAPQWVAVQSARKIDQVVVLFVPGVDKTLLETFFKATAVRNGSPNSHMPLSHSKDVNIGENGSAVTTSFDETLSSTPSMYIIPVKAPGDRKTSRFYSSLQAMLISDEPKEQKKDSAKQGAFRPERTPVAHLVHRVDELLTAEFPIHPACFANDEDTTLEKQRREATGQALADGWVDSAVTKSIPDIGTDPVDTNSLTQGLDVFAIDCEMVLTTDDKYSLARISVLNWMGKSVLETKVKPALPVKDYFTQYSGITPKLLEDVTTTLENVQQRLLSLLTSKAVLVGHSLESDLNALKLTHPFIADTSLLYPHPRGLPLRSSLKFLANKYLRREIQTGLNGHDSVEDARAALDLVRLKTEKGPKLGVADANGESIFSRLSRSGRKTAVVDYGNQERGFGQHATVKVACNDDDEVTDGVVSNLTKCEGQTTAFIWARLRDMEKARNWTSGRDHYTSTKTTSDAAPSIYDVEEAAQKTLGRLRTIYDSLPDSTMFMVYPGPGDMSEVLRLQDVYKTFQREFKVKKWDQLSVQWTDTEVQAQRSAFDKARRGWAMVGIK